MSSKGEQYNPMVERPSGSSTKICFPQTKCSLWDKTATGNSVFLNIGYYRKPRICIPEKILRLIQHQCENYSQTHHMLIGSLVVEDDSEGVQFQVDRLDTRDTIPSDGSGLAPGDLLIPLQVTNNKDNERCGSVEDYHCALRRLQSRCCSQAAVDLCEFVLLRGWGSFYSNAHTCVVHLDFDMVAMETVFEATPVVPVPILLTALSKNLAGPMSLSQVQGTPKTGYLSMDHARKLLLVLESDPKACTLPIVGIWVSGAEFVQHPFVWASCLRYIHNSQLQDRVCGPPDQFLLVVYTPLHSKPEFYQVCPTSGTSDLQFQLRSGHEVTNMSKSLSAPCHDFTEVELDAASEGRKMEIFDAAKAKHGLDLSKGKSDVKTTSLLEDIEPRSAPSPHIERSFQMPSIRPMVPDVSILWTDSADSFQQSQQGSQASNFGQPPHSSSHHVNGTNNFSLTSAYNQQSYYRPFLNASNSQNTENSSRGCSDILPQQRETGQLCTPIVNNTQTNASSNEAYHHSMSNVTSTIGNMSQGTFKNSANTATSGSRSSKALQLVTGEVNYIPPQMAPTSYINTTDSPVYTNANVYMQACHSQQPASAASAATALPSISPLQSQPGYQGKQPMNSISNTQQQVKGRFSTPSSLTFTPAPQSSQNQINIETPKSGRLPLISSQQYHQNNNNEYSNPGQRMQSGVRARDSVPNQAPFTFLKTVVEEATNSSSHIPQVKPYLNHNNNAQVVSQDVSRNQIESNNNLVPNVNVDHNATASCQSSDDDSGLSITPDQITSCPSQQCLQNAGQSCSEPHHVPAGNSIGQQLLQKQVDAPMQPAAPQSLNVPASLDSVKWAEVPPAVQALLQQQNQQLQFLQQQIQMLLLNQSQQMASASPQSNLGQSRENSSQIRDQVISSPCSSQSQNLNSNQHGQVLASNQDKMEMCSIGVNTTMLDDSCVSEAGQHTTRDSRSVQTSPVRTHTNFPSLFVSPVLPDGSRGSTTNTVAPSSGTTPSELQHHNPPPICSTTYESPGFTPRGVPTSKPSRVASKTSVKENTDDVHRRDLSDFMSSLPIQELTMQSEPSQMMVDMPDYASSVNDAFAMDHSKSPPSVSECFNQGQDDSYSTVAEDALDPKQYYSQLMNNIQMFLKNDANPETKETTQDRIENEQQVKNLSPLKSQGDEVSSNSSITPGINYVSLMLGSNNGSGICSTPGGTRGGCSIWGSDPGQSMEINAMAMKYLSDEQLTQMALLRRMQEAAGGGGQKSGRSSMASAQVLQQVLKGQGLSADVSTDISRLGLSPNDMTMATQKYLEKHGLLGSCDSVMMTSTGSGACSNGNSNIFDQSIKLRTDFSMMKSMVSDNERMKTSSIIGANENNPAFYTDTPERKNYNDEATPVRTGGNEEPSFGEAESHPTPVLWKTNVKQKKSSPVATKPSNKPRQVHADKQNNSPLNYPMHRVGLHRMNDSTSTEEAEEENILDIARLKQMPKLL